MIPPICAVCKNRLNRKNNIRGSLVYFIDDEQHCERGFIGMKWFCTLHEPRARQLSEEKYTVQVAIDLIKKECCID